MECPSCKQVISDSAKCCPKCSTEIKHDYIWLTIPNCSHAKDIKFKPDSTLEKDLGDEIWFEDTPENRAKAESLVKAIKQLIYSSYPNKQKPKWLTEDWVNASIKWNE